MRPMRTTSLFFAASIFLSSSAAFAVDADPSNYKTILPTLKPGDTLNLAPGTYTSGLNITNLNGSEGAWITIAGPASGPPAVFEGNACCNTVEITSSSYVVVRGITVDGKQIPGVFGVSAKGGLKNVVHHITIEGCTFVGQGGSQQTVGISTKTPTSSWIIRQNVIDGAGTGIYLGNSTYADPFVDGLIENNLIKNTIGYNMQIKSQDPWPDHAAMPAGATKTIIRDNVFIKNDAPSPDGNRPNVFVGAFPDSGPGAGSMVERSPPGSSRSGFRAREAAAQGARAARGPGGAAGQRRAGLVEPAARGPAEATAVRAARRGAAAAAWWGRAGAGGASRGSARSWPGSRAEGDGGAEGELQKNRIDRRFKRASWAFSRRPKG